MDEVCDLLHERKVVAAEAVGGLPGIVSVLVETTEGDGVPGAGGRVVQPDGGLDRAEADFVDGLVVHDGCSFRGERVHSLSSKMLATRNKPHENRPHPRGKASYNAEGGDDHHPRLRVNNSYLRITRLCSCMVLRS